MDRRINILPVPTWNKLSVNAAGDSLTLPELTKELMDASAPHFEAGLLPAGVARMEEITDPRAVMEGIPEDAPLESGIGSYYDQYIKTQANARFFIKGTKETAEDKADIDMKTSVRISAQSPYALSHHQIYAEEGSTLSLMQSISSDPGAEGLAADLTEIFAKKDATVRLFQIQTADVAVRSYQGVAIYAEEGATVEIVRAVMGSAAAACGTRALLSGKGSSYTLHAIYFAAGSQYFDFNDIADHRAKNTTSDMYTAGALAGESRKILRGTIDFKKGASYAVGHEVEDVLMLSNKAKNRIVPLILCGEENVEGQHAASSGKPDERELYYLCTRGLTPKEANRLIVEGRFAPVIDRIPDDEVREILSAEIERRLSLYEDSAQ
ncbi:MAG: SufD family Fe-S cluster assembly protein [Eubacteriales bacterium]|nr:SufD family Fe-S cluster assembly protein [Eubacteriales bacterium]